MTTYRLQSSSMVHTPGIIAWAINGYAFQSDRQTILNTISQTYSAVPITALEQLLSKAIPYTVEDETIVFAVEDQAMPTLNCRKCSATNPMVYFGVVSDGCSGSCVCYDCANDQGWLDCDGNLRNGYQV